jgi:RimJ/RimL family protein N-acetyltransferase/predicted kinase
MTAIDGKANLLLDNADISVRLITPEDVDFITRIEMDASVWCFEPVQDIPTDADKVQNDVKSHIDCESYMEFIISLNDGTNRPVGECHLHWFEIDRGSWELGYCILPEYRGRGYCTLAVKKLIDLAFLACKAHKLVAMCNEFNTASSRVLEKCGMKKELVIREELPWHNTWVNQFLYSLLDHEYDAEAKEKAAGMKDGGTSAWRDSKRDTALHLMVGLPCSGKTTYAYKLKDECKALLFTPDVWHLKLFGDDLGSPDHDKHHDTVESIMWEAAVQALQLDVNVILDFGFWVREQRDFYRNKAKELGVGFHIHYMNVPLQEIKQRLLNRNSQGKKDVFFISMESIDKWAEIFEPPTREELDS